MAGFRWPYRIADIARIWPEFATPKNKLVGRWEQTIALLERRDQAVEDWINTDGAGGGREYGTVVVAAVDSHQEGKDGANFVAAGGGADHVTLQQAVDSLPLGPLGLPAGRIVLLEGIFDGSGDVDITGVNVDIVGQGVTQSSYNTVVQGINLIASSPGTLGLRDLAWVGNITGTGLTIRLQDMILAGDVTAFVNEFERVNHAGDLTIAAGGTLSLDAGANIAGGTISGSSMGSARIFNFSTTGAIDLAGLEVWIDGLKLTSTTQATIELSDFSVGGVVGLQGDGLDTTLLTLSDTQNIRVVGHFGTLTSAVPQVVVRVVGGVSQNNSISTSHFEGNAENPLKVGAQTYHVEVGAGVVGTILSCNHYGGAALGDILDNGTGTITECAPEDSISGGGASSDAALLWMGAGHRESTSSGGCGDCSSDESLLWMQAANAGPTGSPGAAGTAADESLIWMFAGTGPRGDTGATGATGATGSGGADEGLLWMGSGHRESTIKAPPLKGVVVTRAVQSIANASGTDISYDTEVEDSSGFFAPTSTTITIPTGEGGIYSLSLRAGINASATGRSFIVITANGIIWRAAFAANEDQIGIGVTVRLAAGATIVTSMFQTSGATRNLNARLEVWKIGT